MKKLARIIISSTLISVTSFMPVIQAQASDFDRIWSDMQRRHLGALQGHAPKGVHVERHHYERHDHHHHHHHERRVERRVERRIETKTNTNGEAIAAGFLGLAAGAILSNAFKPTQQTQVIYPTPPAYGYAAPARVAPPTIYPPAPVAVQAQPWTPAWYNYCNKRYRSFNPKTGTFRGYNGKDYFCVAP